MRFTLVLLFILIITDGNGQSYMIRYEKSVNDKVNNDDAVTVIFNNNISVLSGSVSQEKKYIDYNKKQIVSILHTDNEHYKVISNFDDLPQPEFNDEPLSILDHPCRKATFKYFSNTIEVWYTKDGEIKGAPLSRYLPNSDCLVLKVLINGSYKYEAKSIEQIEHFVLNYKYDNAKSLSKPEYAEKLIESKYTSISIFRKERINFEPDLIPGSRGSSDNTLRFSKGTIILRKIGLPKHTSNGFYFLNLTNRSNGDAYDRTGTVFTFSSDKDVSILTALKEGIEVLPKFSDESGEEYQGFIKTINYTPPIELMRFFTSFGAGHFNSKRVINNYNWSDSVVYKQDVSSLITNEADSIWIGVFIGNYDKGGHVLDLELLHYPAFEENEVKDKWLMPLFNTINILEMSGQNYSKFFKTQELSVEFEMPDDISDVQLLFTSTGHGGWGEGDEFTPRVNRVRIDNKEYFCQAPWRNDCATYRMLNPASGNFKNGLSSSDLSRSNWCPATVTPPYVIPLTDLKPGKHTITVSIDQGNDAGSSFNAWNVSGVLVGETAPK